MVWYYVWKPFLLTIRLSGILLFSRLHGAFSLTLRRFRSIARRSYPFIRVQKHRRYIKTR